MRNLSLNHRLMIATIWVVAITLAAYADDAGNGSGELRSNHPSASATGKTVAPARIRPAVQVAAVPEEVEPGTRMPTPPPPIVRNTPDSRPTVQPADNTIQAPHQLHTVPESPTRVVYQHPACSSVNAPVTQGCRECGPCGNQWYQSHHDFWRDPSGVCLHSTLNAQVVSGLIGQAVLYRYDFNDGQPDLNGLSYDPSQLSPRGEKQLRKIADKWFCVPEPRLIIEPTGNVPLDAARRAEVIMRLGNYLPVPVVPEWVQTDDPCVPGTSGIEAEIQCENLWRQTKSAAQPTVGSGTYGSNNTNSQSASSQGNNH